MAFAVFFLPFFGLDLDTCGVGLVMVWSCGFVNISVFMAR